MKYYLAFLLTLAILLAAGLVFLGINVRMMQVRVNAAAEQSREIEVYFNHIGKIIPTPTPQPSPQPRL